VGRPPVLLAWRPVTTDAQAVPAAAPSPRVRAIVLQGLLFFLLMVAYEGARHLVEPGTPAVPLDHASQIIDAERAMGLFVEPDIQRFTEDTPGLESASKWIYTLAHTPGFILFFVWMWFRQKARFAFVRNWFWVMNGVAVLGYWLYPLAPPRLVPELGLSDPTAASLELGGSLTWFQPFRNIFAAMPSMHVGYTVFFAVAIILLLKSPWRWLALVWPATILYVVMATANHYWLDGVGGAVTCGIALLITALVWRRLRRPWQHDGVLT
jgi:PAP2 superfamily